MASLCRCSSSTDADCCVLPASRDRSRRGAAAAAAVAAAVAVEERGGGGRYSTPLDDCSRDDIHSKHYIYICK